MRTRIAVVLVALAPACLDAPDNNESGLTISVAPLSLSGIVEACYDLSVTAGPNGSGAVVWSKANVCSTRYGDGHGALDFVGTCDASVAQNSVVLTLVSLADGEGPAAFVNPCSAATPCVKSAACVANGDTRVAFDLTVMRTAEQGFFDVAVAFEDIFCSAKIDCESNLLFDPRVADGPRVPTAVMALTCASGASTDTELYLDDVVLDCGTPRVLAVGGPPGNVYTQVSAAPSPLLQLATYRTSELVTDGNGAPWRSLGYTVALALDFDAVNAPCDLTATMTASSTAFVPPYTGPSGARYPLVRVDVPLVAAGDLDNYGCERHALGDGPEDFIWTDYTPMSGPPIVFEHHAHTVGAALVVEERREIGAAPALAFGTFYVGQTSTTQRVTVTANAGTVHVGTVSASGDFAIAAHTCTTLATNGTCTIDVRFAPTAGGTRSGTLTIDSDAVPSPKTLALSGIGVVPANLVLSPTTVTMTAGTTQLFTATGGVTPYVYGVVSGGGSFSGATYTAGAAGSAVVKVTDALGVQRTANITIEPAGPPVVGYTIASHTTNFDLGATLGLAVASNVTVTINANVRVDSASTSQPAFTVGTLPAGSTVTVVNRGFIIGAGGAGGQGGWIANGNPGQPGGIAFNATRNVTIDNVGGVIGGGGGGGGGAAGGQCGTEGGGGGGGAGIVGGSGGTSGINNNYPGQPGGFINVATTYNGSGGPSPFRGGDGGTLGQPGQAGAGAPVQCAGTAKTGGAGGAAGVSVKTNGFTVNVTGGTVY